MHVNDPMESRSVNDPNQAIADPAWRAEVASRVNNYQARRHRRYTGENAPALDFGPAAEAPNFGAPSPGAEVQIQDQPTYNTVRNAICNPTRNAVRNAIDTNYYRRLNAESMAQGSLGQALAATAPAQEYETEFEADTGNAAETADTMPDFLMDREAAESDLAENYSALNLEISPAVADDSLSDHHCVAAPEPDPEPPAAPDQGNAQGNLIVFPRPALEPPLLPKPSRDELAEPMNRRPRILEVPEDIMPAVQASLFPEIRLDADADEGTSGCKSEIEVPLRVAPLSARLTAGLADLGITIAAGLLFAAVAIRALPDVPHTKPFWMTLSAVTVLLWAIYQHLFLLYGGRTLGMSLRGIRLNTFEGQHPQWNQRRRRARFMIISFAAVTLGFLWALADEDALCWHDRISRTFPTTE